MYTHQFRCQPVGGATSQGSYDAALSFLKQLNSQELQSLMDDTERLNKLVDDLELVKNQQQEKETILARNKSLAEYNLTLEPRLVQSRQQLAETYEQAVKVQKDFENDKLKLDSHVSHTSLDTTLALLQMEAAKADEESEQVAEAFLSRPSDVETFLNNYTALRTKAHLRKVKVEKLEELMNQQQVQQRAAAATPANNSFVQPIPTRVAPVPPYPVPPTTWAPQAPYPVNSSFAMPNPAAYLPR